MEVLRMGGNEMISFKIISTVGTARSMYIEAIAKAKAGDFERADNLIKEGNEKFLEGHKAHVTLIQKEANGEKVELSLILMHAEDQLMSAETVKIVAQEIIDIYRNK